MIIGKYRIDFYPSDDVNLKPTEAWVKKEYLEGGTFDAEKLIGALEKALDEFWAENF